MDFDDRIGRLNEHFFLREFTFTKCLRPDHQDEVADGIVVLDEIIIAVENKERKMAPVRTGATEARWFDKKLKEAVRQLRKSHGYVTRGEAIELFNGAGDAEAILVPPGAKVHYVALISADPALPADRRLKKHHVSKTTGIFIHVFNPLAYQEVLKTLVTPTEINEYLHFREQIILRWTKEAAPLNERALLGQFISTKWTWLPEAGFEAFLERLIKDEQSWSISAILRDFRAHTPERSSKEYYKVIREIALLKRSYLKHFLQRFRLVFEAARKGEMAGPFRFVAGTGCGFVFSACPPELARCETNGLLKFTLGHKYDQKLERCVGVNFLPLGDNEYSVGWSYISEPWKFDEDLEDLVHPDKSPFLEVNHAQEATYQFR